MRILHRLAPLAVAAAAVAAALAGGASSATHALAPAIDPPGCKPPKKFPMATYGETYLTYCQICFDVGPKALKKDYKLQNVAVTDRVKIATIYGKRDEYGTHRLAAIQGCLRGFGVRGTP
jgi:hypothetical protein